MFAPHKQASHCSTLAENRVQCSQIIAYMYWGWQVMPFEAHNTLHSRYCYYSYFSDEENKLSYFEFWEGKWIEGQTRRKWQSWDSYSGSLASENASNDSTIQLIFHDYTESMLKKFFLISWFKYLKYLKNTLLAKENPSICCLHFPTIWPVDCQLVFGLLREQYMRYPWKAMFCFHFSPQIFTAEFKLIGLPSE